MKSIIILFLLFSITIYSQELIHEIRNINSDCTDFSDLSFLENVLKDVKIVALGEQSHSDGPTFEAKVRLIKYLHENLGYNVLAFESGLYDCSKANHLIENRPIGNNTNYLNQALFGIWDCKEVHKLATYIDETYKTSNPLILTGFDCQFAGIFARKHLVEDFNQCINYIENNTDQQINIDTVQLNSSLRSLTRYSNFFKKLSPNDTLTLSNTIDKLSSILKNKNIDNEYIAYWKQLFISIKADYRRKYVNSDTGKLRDSIMAENTKWIVNEQYKNEKIILWAANTHIANSTKSVNHKYLSKNNLMGSYLKNTFGNNYYCLAFTSFEGDVTGMWFLDYLIMNKPKKNSIESFLNKQGYDYSFINLLNFKEQENPYFFNSKIFGHSPYNMNLFEVVDGIFYIKNMYPATYKY